ncbi:MAG TPA: PIN domain-containing protein [Candidatus Eisenbacteria bacterium]|nr:PIN domain-containing protein [Candidatus Eisenbacteria bacterium]
MRTHVLDASALYGFLTEGDGALVVMDVLKQASAEGTTVMMSAVNWGEVYYSLAKRIGHSKTEAVMTEALLKAPLAVAGVSSDDAVRAARLKAQYDLPYADAFAAALTGNQHVLVTADVEHFERAPKLRLLKLPRAKKS